MYHEYANFIKYWAIMLITLNVPELYRIRIRISNLNFI